MELFKKYREVEEFLFKQLPMYQRVGPKAFKKDLNNIRFLLDQLGNPQSKLRAVHVAGTNGKGSVSHFIAALLKANGMRVGIYTSPHFKTYRERIKIDGKYIPKTYVLDFVNRLIEKGVFKNERHQLSFFELTVGLAFEYFAKQKPDIVVIETGLGGRLDSTNVINPLLSVITNISLDHTAFLGDSIEQIAIEKAGIIKANRPVVIGKDQHECQHVYIEKSKGLNAQLYYAEHLVDLKQITDSIKGNSYCYSYAGKEVKFKTSLIGDFQLENLRTAICSVLILSEVYNIPFRRRKSLEMAFEKVLHEMKYMGRLQVIGRKPLEIFDSAHNVDAIEKLMALISKMKFKRKRIIYGSVKDKDLSNILNELDKSAVYYLCKANVPRAMDAKLLEEEFSKRNFEFQSFQTVKSAFKQAKEDAHKDDLILVTGSIFVVAELL